MKKAIFLVTLFCIVCINCFSQYKNHFGVTSGISIPQNDFAAKSLISEAAGFAKPGLVLDAFYGYRFAENLGVTAMAKWQQHAFNSAAMEKALSDGYPDSIFTVQSSKSWEAASFLGGLYTTFPVTSNVSFDGRAMIGAINISSPEIKTTFSDKNTNNTATSLQKSKSTIAFAALFGCGLKIDVGKRLCFFTFADYFITKPTYKDVETIAFDGSVTKRTFDQEIGAFNFSGGLGFRF